MLNLNIPFCAASSGCILSIQGAHSEVSNELLWLGKKNTGNAEKFKIERHEGQALNAVPHAFIIFDPH